MSENDAAGTSTLADRERTTDDLGRLGLVVGVAFAGLAVLGLAWTVTPTSVSNAALGVGAVGILSLSGLGLVAAHRRVGDRLDVHAEAIESAHRAASRASSNAGTDVAERLDAIEARLEEVEDTQTEEILEILDTTEAPATGAETPTQG